MSISAYYDPERDHIREVFNSIEQKLGPLWYFATDEQRLMKKFELCMLTDEEKRHALDRYREIKAREAREERMEIRRKRERGGWIVLLILVLIGMVIAAIAK